MKKLLVLLLVIVAANVNAQQFLGTKSLYTVPTAKPTPPPKGYTPVFINHVGRHGARHLTKEVNTSYAYGILSKADSAHALTTKGQQLWLMVKNLANVERGKVKSISAEGVTELQGIGSRMTANYPTVFAKGVNLNVTETKEIRTKQSADAFMVGFKKNLGKEPMIKEYVDDTNLRYFDLSPAYVKFEEEGVWVKQRELIAKQLNLEQVNADVAQRFFTPGFLKTLKAANRDKFVSDIFGFATITYSLKEETKQAGFKPADVDFFSLFTPKEINVLSQLDLADDYYAKGPGVDPNGIQVKVATPLLANFINTADEFIKAGTYNAQLRFAHAETISPFATLLDISVASKATKTTNIGAVWQAGTVIPLSANIQWIFYKNAEGNYLVKVLLNEKEVRINNISTTTYPYYSWTQLRKLYMSKLQSLHLDLNDDMNKFLQNVK